MARIDAKLEHDVIDELNLDPSLDASKIGVAASNAIITLTGSARTYAEKLAAEEGVKRVVGVRGIANELEIDLPQSHVRNDTDIARVAVSILQWDTTLPQDSITISVSNGFVTLDGQLDWQYQKERAKTLVQSIAGVRGVSEHFTIKPSVIVSDVKAKIRQAFQRGAEIDADRIQVETSDGVVKLRGTVHSWAERADATRAAYSIRGVRLVENFTQVF